MKPQLLKSVRKPLAALAATVLVASSAHAAAAGKLVLSGFEDAADGEQLLAGDYGAVIQKLAAHSLDFAADEVAASTNLCVAYVASGRLHEAQGACNEAIAMARLMDRDVSLSERLAHTDALSVAYANRAVLTRLSGE